MNEIIPDTWIVIRIKDETIAPGYLDRVLAGWHGGYLNGDSWRLNSGIKKATEFKHYWKFYGYSGSVYKCYKNRQKFSTYTKSIYEDFCRRIPETSSIDILTLKENK